MKELEKRIEALENGKTQEAKKTPAKDIVKGDTPKNILDLIMDALDLTEEEEGLNIPIYDSNTHRYLRIIELWDMQEYEKASRRIDKLGHQQLKELYVTIKNGPYAVNPDLIDFVWDKI